MRWKNKIIAAAGAACAFAAVAATPASAQGFGSPFAAPTNCYWQRFDGGRVDLVEQVCRDRWGRSYIVPGSRYTLVDRNRGQWRRWNDRDYRDWDRRDWNNRRDWDDRRDWDRDRNWDRDRDRDRWDNDRDRGRDRDRDRDRDWDR